LLFFIPAEWQDQAAPASTFFPLPMGCLWNWVHQTISPDELNSSSIHGVSIATNGDLFGVGTAYNTNIPIAETVIITGRDSQRFFLTRLPKDGDVIWGRSFGGTDGEYVEGLTSDSDDNVFVVGHFDSPELPLGSTTLVNAGGFNGFVSKHDSEGNPIWARSFGSLGFDLCEAVDIDPITKSVYVVGTLNLFGESRMLLQKFSPDGTLVWEIQGSDQFPFSRGYGLDLDSDGNCYICGSSGSGAVVWKIGRTGEIIWRKYSRSSAPRSEVFEDIKIGPNNSIYVTGYFDGKSQMVLDNFMILNSQEEAYAPTAIVAKLTADPPAIRHQRAADQLVFSWPTNQPGFLLEANSLSFQPQDWQALSTDVWNGRNVVTNSLDQPGRVFRLKKEVPAP
jgi:hypothetical protein